MPLDPQIQTLLAQEVPPVYAAPLDVVRNEIRKNLPAASGAPAPVARVEDVRVPVQGGDIRLRLYTPEGRGPFPVFVFIHGGGWVLGDLDAFDNICRNLTHASGCLVAAVEYRLAPEHKFPTALDDCHAALQWVAASIGEHGGDASRLAVGGDSAGGNMTAVLTQLARAQGGPAIRYQVLIYPVTTFHFDQPSMEKYAKGYWLTRAEMEWFRECYLRSREDWDDLRASPLLAENLRGLPPALVITAEYDTLHDQGEAYARRLEAAGVPVEYKCYAGVVHPFFNMSGVVDKARQAQAHVAEALRRALHA